MPSPVIITECLTILWLPNFSGCDYGCIQPNLVKGKILLCKNFLPPQVAAISKAMGVIMSDRLGASDTPFFIDYAKVFPIAESLLRRKDFDRLFSYFTSTR